MSVIGDSTRWRDGLINAYDLVRESILHAWPDCCARIRSEPLTVIRPASTSKGRKHRQEREDPITRDLIRRLKRDTEIRTRFHVESQRELIEESLDLDPDPTGYNDIAILFRVGLDEACLALECKRLNVVWKSRPDPLARKYVLDGMMRFVSGQYSKGFPVGGMIGYVMDGDVAAAHSSVLDQINKASLRLLCDPSGIVIINHPDYFLTTHDRQPNAIELRHQLLSVT